jgi:hypothetical protein
MRIAQLKHTRKEWDLNRPDATMIENPARVGDEDPRLGASSMQVSSLSLVLSIGLALVLCEFPYFPSHTQVHATRQPHTQVFQGEDLSAGDRKVAQMEQSRRWWEEQSAHRAAVRSAQQAAEAAYGELVKYQDALASHLKAEEAAVRRQLASTTTQVDNACSYSSAFFVCSCLSSGYASPRMCNQCITQDNQRMAEEKRLKALADKAADLAASMAEIDAWVTSPWLTEDPATAASTLSAYRRVSLGGVIKGRVACRDATAGWGAILSCGGSTHTR